MSACALAETRGGALTGRRASGSSPGRRRGAGGAGAGREGGVGGTRRGESL